MKCLWTNLMNSNIILNYKRWKIRKMNLSLPVLRNAKIFIFLYPPKRSENLRTDIPLLNAIDSICPKLGLFFPLKSMELFLFWWEKVCSLNIFNYSWISPHAKFSLLFYRRLPKNFDGSTPNSVWENSNFKLQIRSLHYTENIILYTTKGASDQAICFLSMLIFKKWSFENKTAYNHLWTISVRESPDQKKIYCTL